MPTSQAISLSKAGDMFAMIDPTSAAAGGLLAIGLFVVGPVALVTHLIVRRFFAVSASIAGFCGLPLRALAKISAEANPNEWGSHLRLACLGFVAALIVSLIAGIPSLAWRLVEQWKRTAEDV